MTDIIDAVLNDNAIKLEKILQLSIENIDSVIIDEIYYDKIKYVHTLTPMRTMSITTSIYQGQTLKYELNPLYIAIINRKYDSFMILLKYGANPNLTGGYPCDFVLNHALKYQIDLPNEEGKIIADDRYLTALLSNKKNTNIWVSPVYDIYSCVPKFTYMLNNPNADYFHYWDIIDKLLKYSNKTKFKKPSKFNIYIYVRTEEHLAILINNNIELTLNDLSACLTKTRFNYSYDIGVKMFDYYIKGGGNIFAIVKYHELDRRQVKDIMKYFNITDPTKIKKYYIRLNFDLFVRYCNTTQITNIMVYPDYPDLLTRIQEYDTAFYKLEGKILQYIRDNQIIEKMSLSSLKYKTVINFLETFGVCNQRELEKLPTDILQYIEFVLQDPCILTELIEKRTEKITQNITNIENILNILKK